MTVLRRRSRFEVDEEADSDARGRNANRCGEEKIVALRRRRSIFEVDEEARDRGATDEEAESERQDLFAGEKTRPS